MTLKSYLFRRKWYVFAGCLAGNNTTPYTPHSHTSRCARAPVVSITKLTFLNQTRKQTGSVIVPSQLFSPTRPPPSPPPVVKVAFCLPWSPVAESVPGQNGLTHFGRDEIHATTAAAAMVRWKENTRQIHMWRYQLKWIQRFQTIFL